MTVGQYSLYTKPFLIFFFFYLDKYNKEQTCDYLSSKPLWFLDWSTNLPEFIAAKDWSPNPTAFTSLKLLSNSRPSMVFTTTSVMVKKLSPEKPHWLFLQIYIMWEMLWGEDFHISDCEKYNAWKLENQLLWSTQNIKHHSSYMLPMFLKTPKMVIFDKPSYD